MDIRTVIFRAAVLALAATLHLHAQVNASLETKQTTVTLQATDGAPRLVDLRSGKLTAWKNSSSEPLIDSVEIDGGKVPLQWKLDRGASHSDRTSVTFVYLSSPARLRLSWEWKARADSGPVEHTIRIENLDTREMWLPLQDSFDFQFTTTAAEALETLYVEKGLSRPSEVGTHLAPVTVGYQWEGKSSSYGATPTARAGANQAAGEGANQAAREIIPLFMVERKDASEDGWYAGIEFSGRTHLTLQRDAASLHGSVGLDPNPGPFRTRLLPNESFETPTVMIGAFSGGPDGFGNVLRPWERQVLNNPSTLQNPNYPELVMNTWGSGMAIDEDLVMRMLHDSANLGLEMLHIDAGWFRGVGDWYPSPTKFPHGLTPIADEAHRLGMKFGIWVDWAQAGADTDPGALNANDPKVKDWLVADVPPDWKPNRFVGRTMDIGDPPVKDYVEHEIDRIVTDYHLDMLEHDGYLLAKNCSRTDHPHSESAPPQMSTVNGNGSAMPDTADSTDINYHATRAYYEIYSNLRLQHPGILLEACNDGGRMVDFGTAAHVDYFSITDSYDPVPNRRAFFDASHVLPPAMLEVYERKWPTPHIENFRYMLRSGMMGWLSVMQDTNEWTEEQHAAAKVEFALYKKELRPLIRDADMYHISERPDGVHWDGLEYFDPSNGHGVVYAFRGTTADEGQHTFVLQGLRPDRKYHLRFQDHSSADSTVSGRDLLSMGLTVVLPLTESSELVFLEESGR